MSGRSTSVSGTNKTIESSWILAMCEACSRYPGNLKTVKTWFLSSWVFESNLTYKHGDDWIWYFRANIIEVMLKKQNGLNNKRGVVGSLSTDEGRIMRSYVGVEKANRKMWLKLGLGHQWRPRKSNSVTRKWGQFCHPGSIFQCMERYLVAISVKFRGGATGI